MVKLFHRFLNDDTGATAIEYCMITICISVAIIAVVNGFGLKLNATFSSAGSDAWHVDAFP